LVEIRWSFFRASVFTLNTDTNKIGSVLLFMPQYSYVFKKVNSALGKHQINFLLNQMQQTVITHSRVVGKISWS